MHFALFQTLLLVGLASSRSIDIHIETDGEGALLDNGVSPAASCYWDGTSPFCAGGCSGGYSDCATSSCGDGACCVTGYKKYCCRGGCPNLQGIHSLVADPPKKQHTKSKPHKAPENNLESQQPSACYWSGTSPFCAGSCDAEGYSDCATSSCGDGACCVTGYKKYCCRGGCGRINEEEISAANNTSHAMDGDNDDICKDDEFLCCPPAASRNRECKCIAKKKAPEGLRHGQSQMVFNDDHNGQLCGEKQTTCCNPGTESNDECACIDE